MISDLQSDIEIGDDGDITGTLLYVEGYTGFSGAVEEQSGNFLALHFDAPDEATIKVKLNIESTLDEDRICIFRVADKDEQVIEATLTMPDGQTVHKVYDLSGLTCNES